MSEVLKLRKEITSFSKAERIDAYSKIIINVTDDMYYEAGDNTGRTLTLSCPWGTQSMANNLLAQMRGFSYQPFAAEGAMLDPAAELGDGVHVNGIYSGIYRMDTTFNSHCSANISAPFDEEVNYIFPYESKQNREIKRQNKKFSSQLTIHSDQIAAEVEQRKNDVATLNGKLTVQAGQITAEVKQREEDIATLNGKLTVQAGQITAEVKERKDDVKTLTGTLDVQANQIVAKVNKTEGSSSTFGWALETASWRIFAGSSTVLKATKDGLEVKGKITATSGTIGGFDINSNDISYKEQTWGGEVTNGIYIGISGIQLGKNFSVDNAGNISATSGTIGGFTINGDHISNNNHTWGSTNTTGIYIGVNGIQLGKNFKVDSAGNLYANSGTFEGTVTAGKILYGGNYGTLNGAAMTDGTLNGSALTDGTLNGAALTDGTLNGTSLIANTIPGGKLKYNTVSTSYTSSGINTSLGWADFANGVFNGWNTANYFKVVDKGFHLGDYDGGWQEIAYKDHNGNNRTVRVLAGQ